MGIADVPDAPWQLDAIAFQQRPACGNSADLPSPAVGTAAVLVTISVAGTEC